MPKVLLNPKNFTPPLGAYSHGVKAEIGDAEIIFVTGQMAIDSKGKPVAPGNIKKQTEFIFQNIQKILGEAHASLDNVAKATIFLKNMKDFKEMSAVRDKYFAKARPASTCVEISDTVKKGCDVVIEVIAVKRKAEFW
ncbi:MAG: RidA family protein [Candidatus Diapherotrites archaeon]